MGYQLLLWYVWHFKVILEDNIKYEGNESREQAILALGLWGGEWW